MSADVQITIDGELTELRNELNSLEGEIKSWGGRIADVGLTAFAVWGSAKAFEAVIGGLSQVVSLAKECAAAAAEAALVDATLESVLTATGNAAGFTADQLKRVAGELESITLFDDEAIKGAETIIATFKNIKGDEFQRATRLALDMATVMGSDAAGAANELGRALANPQRGLMMLEKQGVAFTESQKKMIQSMIDSGDVASAQVIIMGELESKYSGAAEAAAKAAGGGITQLHNTIGDLQEEIGNKLLPLIDEVARSLKSHLEPVLADVGREFGDWNLDAGGIESFSSAVAELTRTMVSLAGSLKDGFLPVAQTLLETIKSAVELLPNSGRVTADDRKFVSSLSEDDFKKRNKAFSEAERSTFFFQKQDVLNAVGIGVINNEDYANIKAAFEERQNEINARVSAIHKASGLAGGELEQLGKVLAQMTAFGAQGHVTSDDTATRAAQDEAKVRETLLQQSGIAALGVFQAFGAGAAGVGGKVDNFTTKGDEEKKEKDARPEKEEEFKSSFEDVTSLFKRIQSSAASGGTPELKEAKKTADASEQTKDHTKRTADAAERTAIASEKIAANSGSGGGAARFGP